MEWTLEVRDWVAIAGTLVAALIGVLGVFLALGIERRDRYVARLDETLAGVIRELGERAVTLQEWADERPPPDSAGLRTVWAHMARRGSPGGPPSARLAAAVKIAELAARRPRDRAPLAALGTVVEVLPAARVERQIGLIESASRIVTDWRVGTISHDRFIQIAREIARAARADGVEFAAGPSKE